MEFALILGHGQGKADLLLFERSIAMKKHSREISGDAKAVIDQIVKERRDNSLNHCVAGQTVLSIKLRDGKRLYCVYKAHDRTSITVISSKQTLDWLFRGQNLTLFGGGELTDEEVTFNFADVEIGHG